MGEVLIKALQLIMALSLLVVVHEFGHFIFARIFKVRVEKFYLFFNPWFSLFKFKPKNSDTEYGIGWLPLGGYVKIAGMIDESMDKEQMKQPAQSWEFRSKPAWQRLLIMVGGVLFNFILAIIIYAAIAFHWGEVRLPLRNIKAGMSYSEVAQGAGFKNGDIIWSVDGKEMPNLDVMTLAESETVTVVRDGKKVDITLPSDMMERVIAANTWFAKANIPMVVAEATKGGNADKAGVITNDSIVSINSVNAMSLETVMQMFSELKNTDATIGFYRNGEYNELLVPIDENGKIGIALKQPMDMYDMEYIKYSFVESIPVGISAGIDRLSKYVSSLKYVFTKEGAQSLGGFVSIGNIFPATWDWYAFWNMTAFLSIILAFMNILPIPALDGGHVLFLLYEVVTRRKPSDKFMEYAQMTGMIILFGLLIVANGNDLIKIFFK